jgi:hypothetical protein
VPWLRQFVAGLSLWRLGFSPRSDHVVFVGIKWHWDVLFSKLFAISLSVSVLLVIRGMNNGPVVAADQKQSHLINMNMKMNINNPLLSVGKVTRIEISRKDNSPTYVLCLLIKVR